jgi:hypothetical protein
MELELEVLATVG